MLSAVNVTSVIEWIASVGLTSAAVAAFVVWVARSWISERIKAQIKGEYDREIETLKVQLKAEADGELEKLKSQLNISASERHVRYSKLQERRGEVIAEIYAKLKDLTGSVSNYVSTGEGGVIPPRKERQKTAVDAMNAFWAYYRHNRIFLPKRTVDRIDALAKEGSGAFHEFYLRVDRHGDLENVDFDSWEEVDQRMEQLSGPVFAELEDDLRRLLGDDETDTIAASSAPSSAE